MAAAAAVYAQDLPGHGESSKDVGDGSLVMLSEAVLGLLDAVGVERAHLVGIRWAARWWPGWRAGRRSGWRR
ncbi:hypothetical protein [Saccharopolyspora spinosa]|uniref:hypothetical protein n=1 Tax=Saccharopolyspora spinosa TaxID=60894 RepID=UPI0002378EC9|nr:hypothetical protein [Saccharopolyspora spinosa]